MKIAFIGGGSIRWVPTLVTDMALTESLRGAQLVLHDIDADALKLTSRAAERIVTQLNGHLIISTTLDRAEAMRGADFVILCVAVGGLAAMENDLAIPQRYGMMQTVGDTVGPGGLARGLRHIPFAVKVAREMEELCPDAWLLNLTNPMTTICRAITKATSIKTIGLCHEVSSFCKRLANFLAIPTESIQCEVAGINHLPAIVQCRINKQDGLPIIREWLHGDGAELVEQNLDDPFFDRFALKKRLLQQFGVLYGAGDRHLIEFFAGMLSEANQFGARFGVKLTTVEYRRARAQRYKQELERFVEGENNKELRPSAEQLAGVMAGLSGGPTGQFILNIPNRGQIPQLPHDVVVECIAEIGQFGMRPFLVNTLPQAAHILMIPHISRQELIVETGLSGKREPALAALSTAPLLDDPTIAPKLLDELMTANQPFIEQSLR